MLAVTIKDDKGCISYYNVRNATISHL